ncbi:lamin tail domain-containing protein [Candidatus Saccharibacteria bacterium]|nr:lamin tail domain-containing protein [Candidatus Saccharibacteria bacterium]
MKHIYRITSYSILILSLIVLNARPGAALGVEPTLPPGGETAEPPGQVRRPILIAELSSHGADSTDADFVELYNPNAESVDVTNWLIQYRTASATPDKPWVDKSSTGKDADTKARLGCGSGCVLSIAGKGRLLVASPAAKLAAADVTPAANLGFAGAGGQVRLVSVDAATKVQEQEDLVGYGKISSSGLPAATAEGEPAPAHGAGESLQRMVLPDNELADTDDNRQDFIVAEEPTPGLANVYIPPEEPPVPLPDVEPDLAQETAQLRLNEVLADPAPPLQDSQAEYIELHNVGRQEIVLKGFVLTTGDSKSQRYTFEDDTALTPGEYLAVYARDTGLALTNAGATVTLLTPGGLTLDATTYTGAKPDVAWARNEAGGWQWTDTLTPGAANMLTLKTTVKAPKASTKKPAAKKPAKAKAAKAPKAKKEKAASTPVEAKEASAKRDASVWVAGGMAMVTSGYLAYDYRSVFRRLYERCTSGKGSNGASG